MLPGATPFGVARVTEDDADLFGGLAAPLDLPEVPDEALQWWIVLVGRGFNGEPPRTRIVLPLTT